MSDHKDNKDNKDRSDNRERGGDRGKKYSNKKNNRAPQQNQPRYNETEEAKRQLDNIRRLEAAAKKIGASLGEINKDKRDVMRKERLSEKDRDRALDRIAQYSERVEKLEKELSALSKSVEETNEVMEELRAGMNVARQKLPAKREKRDTDEEFVKRCFQAIQKKVAELNADLASGTAQSIAEERAILTQIQRVKATKQLIPEFISRNRAYVTAAKAHGRAAGQLKSKISFIDTLKAERAELEAQLAQLDAEKAGKRAEVNKVTDNMTAEEQALTTQLNEALSSLREAKEALATNKDAWFEERREKARLQREKQQAEKEKKAQQWAEEQQAKKAERALELKQMVPFSTEMAIANQLIAYLTDLIPKDEEVEHEEVKEETADDDDWGSFSKPKSKKKRGPGKKKKNQKFVLSMATMGQFSGIGCSPPLSRDDIPACLVEVEKALVALKEKSIKEKAKIIANIEKEEREAEEAAAGKGKSEEATVDGDAAKEDTPAADVTTGTEEAPAADAEEAKE